MNNCTGTKVVEGHNVFFDTLGSFKGGPKEKKQSLRKTFAS